MNIRTISFPPNAGHSYVPFAPPNGTHKPGVHPVGYPAARIPLPPFLGGPHSQPYAIPTRGVVHSPIGAVLQVPHAGSRGFGAGRGNAGGPIGGHLSHQQASQQSIGNLGSAFNFPGLDNPNSQPSVGGQLSQTGLMTQAQSGYGIDYANQGTQSGFPGNFLNQNNGVGYSNISTATGNDFISQDYMPHDSQGFFTQAGFNKPHDESSQTDFGLTGSGPLQSQGLMNPLYSRHLTQFNTQPLNLQALPHQPQGQRSQNQKMHYNG